MSVEQPKPASPAAGPAPAAPAPAPAPIPARPSGPTLPHADHVSLFFARHMLGALFLICAAICLYGWRALLSIGLVIGAAAAGLALWRRIGANGPTLRYSQCIWLSLLLALALPPHLLGAPPALAPTQGPLWAILPAAGLLLAILLWLLRGAFASAIHPVAATVLVVSALFATAVAPHYILQRNRMIIGDLADSRGAEPVTTAGESWISARPIPSRDSLFVPQAAASRLSTYTRGLDTPYYSIDALLRDGMPPLEDLVVGGHPGPMGAGSAIAVIIGGLFLLYRGLIDYRIPLLIVLAALVGFLTLPMPLLVTEARVHWNSLLLPRPHADLSTAITFANYELMASPLLFVAFFLATSPALRPMLARNRVIFAILTGLLAAAAQIYISVSIGPYLALLVAGGAAAGLDRWLRPRPLL